MTTPRPDEVRDAEEEGRRACLRGIPAWGIYNPNLHYHERLICGWLRGYYRQARELMYLEMLKAA